MTRTEVRQKRRDDNRVLKGKASTNSKGKSTKRGKRGDVKGRKGTWLITGKGVKRNFPKGMVSTTLKR